MDGPTTTDSIRTENKTNQWTFNPLFLSFYNFKMNSKFSSNYKMTSIFELYSDFNNFTNIEQIIEMAKKQLSETNYQTKAEQHAQKLFEENKNIIEKNNQP